MIMAEWPLVEALGVFCVAAPLCLLAHEVSHALVAVLLMLTGLMQGTAQGRHPVQLKMTVSGFSTLQNVLLLPLYLLSGWPSIAPPHLRLTLFTLGSASQQPPLPSCASAYSSKLEKCIRHAGWLVSVTLAALLTSLPIYPQDAVSWPLLTPPVSPVALQIGVLAAAWLVALSAVSSDLLGLSPASAQLPSATLPRGCRKMHHLHVLMQRSFFCGNLGILIAGIKDSTVDFAKVLRTQVAICMQRGAQSGGIVAIVGGTAESGAQRPAVHGVAVRSAPGKRDNLSSALHKKLSRNLRMKKLLTGQEVGGGACAHALFCGHTRFATSSIATEAESHPHQWTPEAKEAVWRVDICGEEQIQVLARQEESFGLWITHNGDFDFFNLLGQYRTHHDVMEFLSYVLDHPPGATCDSRMVAGMMEFLRTQGRFYPSLRLAFFTTCDVPFEKVKPTGEKRGSKEKQEDKGVRSRGHAPPTVQDLKALAAELEAELVEWLAEKSITDAAERATPCTLPSGSLNKPPVSGRSSYHGVAPSNEGSRMEKALGGADELNSGLLPRLEGKMRAHLQMKGTSSWTSLVTNCRALIEETMDNFLHADLYGATSRFMKGAKGSFGLAVTCTMDPDKVAVAAWGQPMTLGFNFEHRAILYSSESQNVMIPITKEDTDPEEFLPPTIRQAMDISRRGAEGGHSAEDPLCEKNNGWRPGLCTMRVDMDEGGGEVMLLQLHERSAEEALHAMGIRHAVEGWPMLSSAAYGTCPEDMVFGMGHDCGSFVTCRLLQLKSGKEVLSLDEFVRQQRVINLVGSKYIAFQGKAQLEALGNPGKSDLVAADLADTPRVLNSIRSSWDDPSSPNCQTAAALFANLNAVCLNMQQTSYRPDPLEIHVLLVGVEMGMWLAEQAANDLILMFPLLKVAVLSSNKVISVLGNSRGKIPVPGSSFCRLTSRMGPNTVCLAISQSGQTFPTIHATRILNSLLPGRVFVMTGQTDTKMALAIGQRFTSGSPFNHRIFNTFAGWRSAEPPSVVCVAMHQTLTELIMYCARRMTEEYFDATAQPSRPGGPLTWGGNSPLGMSLTPEQLLDLTEVRNAFVDNGAPTLVGVGSDGKTFMSEHYKQLRDMGRFWAKHVTETPIAWALSLVHIIVTVFVGWPVLYAISYGVCKAAQCGDTAFDGVTKTFLLLDGFLYMILPWVYAALLRLIQGRDQMARYGKRTVVICDVPYVHQIIETYVSKLWALSYGMTGLDVHGANPQDHFVHRFTHRVVRGLLLAVGRPDGRMYSQTKAEAATLLSVLQGKVIQHMGGVPEVVSVGNNPYHPTTSVDFNIVLPDFRPRMLVEVLEMFNFMSANAGNDKDIAKGALVGVGGLPGKPLRKSEKGAFLKSKDSTLASTPLSRGRRILQRVSGNSLLHADSSTSIYVPPTFEGKTMNPNQLWAERRAMVSRCSSSLSLAAPESAAPSCTLRTPCQVATEASISVDLAEDDSPKASLNASQNPEGGDYGAAENRAPASSLSVRVDASLRENPFVLKPFSAQHQSTQVSAPRSSLPGDASQVKSLLPREESESSIARNPGSLMKRKSGGVRRSVSSTSLNTGYVVGQHLLTDQEYSDDDDTLSEHSMLESGTLLKVEAQMRGIVSGQAVDEAMVALRSDMEEALVSQAVVEQLMENRYMSMQRMMAFMTMFHAMATRVANLWPLVFDISRSQSGLRIATTAAPATASDLERTLVEFRGAEMLEKVRATQQEKSGARKRAQVVQQEMSERKMLLQSNN